MLSHEFVAFLERQVSRPDGLMTANYNEPMRGDLLWVYEGLTDNLGEVLATRSGLGARSGFAMAGARRRHARPGRRTQWRTLADTAVSGRSCTKRGTIILPAPQRRVLFGRRAAVVRRGHAIASRATRAVAGRFLPGRFLETLAPGARTASRKPYTRASWWRLHPCRPTIGKPLRAARDPWAPHSARRDRERGWRSCTETNDRVLAASEAITNPGLVLFLGPDVKNDGMVKDVAMGGPAQKAGSRRGHITFVNGHAFRWRRCARP